MKRILIAVLIASATLHAQGQREGIAVHGHWTIDVRQPDGTLVTHTEFDNALLPSGANSMVGIFARQINAGLWSVELRNAAGPGPCATANCLITEAASTAPGKNSSNLQLAGVTESGFELNGSVTATSAGSVNAVTSYLGTCSAFAAPGAPPAFPCQGSALNGFTGTTLPSPVAIVSGQIMQVKVAITFSSAGS